MNAMKFDDVRAAYSVFMATNEGVPRSAFKCIITLDRNGVLGKSGDVVLSRFEDDVKARLVVSGGHCPLARRGVVYDPLKVLEEFDRQGIRWIQRGVLDEGNLPSHIRRLAQLASESTGSESYEAMRAEVEKLRHECAKLMAHFKRARTLAEMDGDLMQYSEILAASRPMIPVMQGVYFLVQGDEVVYVGESTNVIARILSHVAEGEKVFDRWALHRTDCDAVARRSLESRYIGVYRPKFNGQKFLAYKEDLRQFAGGDMVVNLPFEQ